ncbi:DUF4402 domain-containing protein [Sphingomonas sp. GCM10030256]|uniref:DUF4402 domain-containing protein n=1 Tax=Sphingomonas sp. GCM10030256 TaxID=3273427 RepID=UPI003607D47E
MPLAPDPRPKAQTALIHPLTVVKRNDLDFGYLGVAGAGTAVINPNTRALSVTGAVTPLGGNPIPATFIGASKSAVVVNIKIPNQPITLTRVGGTETMTVGNWTLQGQDKRTLARMESFEFSIGATLNVKANQMEGLYTGSFDVTIQYP